MGSYDNIVKTEEIRKKVEEGDLQSAQAVLDTMDLKKIKNISDLNLFAEVYKENERYDEAAALYLKIYEKSKTRKTTSQLVDIYIKKGSIEDAQNYLVQYQKLSPEDFDSYIFNYRIEKLKGASYIELINALLTLKKIEFTEQWSYELAKIYYKAGMEAECIKECSDIILWFGEGTYVEKAKMLRSLYLGETDRERMMEKLKRRSEQVSDGNIAETMTDQEDTPEAKEDIYEGSDFMSEHEEEFEVSLKKDIQDMMTYEEPELGEYREEHEDLDKENQEEEYQEEEYQEEEYQEEETAASQVLDESVDPLLDNDYIEDAEADSEDLFTDDNTEEEQQNTFQKRYEQPKLKELDEEDRKLYQIADKYALNPDEIFGNFLHVVSVKKQIAKAMESILSDSKKAVMMIITGTEGSGKTTLAKDMALFLSKTGRINSSKVAKISADKLNTVDLDAKRETLKSCCLVIEDACVLKRATIEKLLDLMKHLQGDIAVVFEEDKKNMNKLFRECPKLMDLLKIRIHLPHYTQEDLIGFAVACLKLKDYRLIPKAEVILKNKVNQIGKQSDPHTYLAQIYELMQSAMNAADIRTGKQLSDLAAQGRLKDVEILSVCPEDFKN